MTRLTIKSSYLFLLFHLHRFQLMRFTFLSMHLHRLDNPLLIHFFHLISTTQSPTQYRLFPEGRFISYFSTQSKIILSSPLVAATWSLLSCPACTCLKVDPSAQRLLDFSTNAQGLLHNGSLKHYKKKYIAKYFPSQFQRKQDFLNSSLRKKTIMPPCTDLRSQVRYRWLRLDKNSL